MTLSPNEAAETLRDIAAVESRSQLVYSYREGSPHLILWGILWATGYALTWIVPQRASAIWIAISAIGFIASYLISYRAGLRRGTLAGEPVDQARRRAAGRRQRTINAIALIGVLFVVAALLVVSPVTPRQIGAFIPLVIAASYAILGLWIGLRFIAIGIALTALTLGGFFLLGPYFTLWMAVVGGGALVLGGLWLRRV